MKKIENVNLFLNGFTEIEVYDKFLSHLFEDVS